MNQVEVYKKIKIQPGITAKQLSKSLKISYNSVTRLLRSLIKSGHIVQRSNNRMRTYRDSRYAYFVNGYSGVKLYGV